MGKDFTSAKGDDNVYTPYSMTEQLLENEFNLESNNFGKKILEPACGNYAIYEILKKYFSRINCIDIKYGQDFFNYHHKCDYIITNPPYSILDDFIIKAKQVATDKFAFLCKITHLGGVGRFESKLYRDPEYPLTKIYMFTRQANLRFNTKYNPGYTELREDGKYPTGMYYYCWLIFENFRQSKLENLRRLYQDYPIFQWINNDKYILRR